MAGQIYGFNQVFDSNGDPLPGALLYTYVPNTTTPKATYTDATLGAQLPNPVVADSAGRFPQIFGDDGEIYDLVLKTSTNVTVQSYYDVSTLGVSSADIDIDFGLDGRFRVIGSGGEPNIEFGDPTGDDVGGDGRIGGWNGTQGTSLEIDFDSTVFTGTISNQDFVEPFQRLLVSGTAVSSTSLDIPLSGTFSMWELQIRNLETSAGAIPQLRFSFDNGATYKSGASDYVYQGVEYTNSGVTSSPTAAAAQINLSANGLGTTDFNAVLIAHITSLAGKETVTLTNYQTFLTTLASSRGGQMGGTTNNTNYGKATNIRIIPSAGNMSYDYRLYGIP